MATTYILISILLFHIIFFRKMIFRWNTFGVFFISTIIFSTIGILLFPFFKEYIIKAFWTFKLELISNQDIYRTQMLAVFGLLLVLYSYVFSMSTMYGRVVCIDLFNIKTPIKNHLSKVNFYSILIFIFSFLFIYLLIKRNVLISGFFDGLIGRQPTALLESRRGITSNYLYVVITYNLLPFLTIVALFLAMKNKTLMSRLLFIVLFSVSFLLILLLFQKRPLILFLLSLFLSAYVFRKYINIKEKKKRTAKERRKMRRRYILIIASLFSLLLLLYYSSTTYKFNNVFEGAIKMTEVAMTRVFGRLAIPAFCYVHYFPLVEDHYAFTNIGMFSKIFRFDLYPDSKVLFSYFSRNKPEGSLAINSIMDFYGSFGYYGFIIGNLILGVLLSLLDAFLNKLEKNNINLIFVIFCFVFAYYLSQASLARSLLGYGFFFFMLTWMFLQKNFKIKLR